MHGLFKSSQSLSNYMALGKIRKNSISLYYFFFFKNLESIGKSI